MKEPRPIHMPLEDLDRAITDALGRIGRMFGAGRAYVIRYDHEQGTATNTHEWCAEGVSSARESLQRVPLDLDLESVATHGRGEPVVFNDIRSVPSGPLRELLEHHGVTALLTMPLMRDGACLGHVGLDAMQPDPPPWPQAVRDVLHLFAELLVHVKVRQEAETELRRVNEVFELTGQIAEIGAWSVDLETNKLWWSPEMFRLHGLEGSVPPALDEVFRFFSPASRHELEASAMRGMADGTPLDLEVELIRADGAHRWVRVLGRPELAAGGRLRIVGAMHDIHERKLAEQALRESEKRLRRLFEDTPSIAVQGYDHERRVFLWNRASEALYGYTRDEALGCRLEDLIIPPSMREDVVAGIEAWLAGGSPIPPGEIDLLRADGTLAPVFSSHTLQQGANGPELYCIDVDLSAQREAEARLRLAASVFEHANEGIMITDPDGTIVEVNAAFERITGYPRDEVLGRNPRILRSPRQDAAFYAEMWRALQSRGHWKGELWNRRRDGHEYAELLTISAVRDPQGEVTHFVALLSDISAIKKHERQLEYVAHHDPLTGLPNRILLADRLQQAMARTARLASMIALVYVDLDGFKAINDAHGHDIGDAMLMRLAKRLRTTVRRGDTVARLGGDEYVIILVDLPTPEAGTALLERVLDELSRPVDVDTRTLQVSASIGVTYYPQSEPIDADQLLRQGDQAMYQAKLAGKNCIHVFDHVRDEALRGRYETLHRLREALVEQEFTLLYQPKVHMQTGSILGVEALIRWQHPEKGLLSPAVFLPAMDGDRLMIDVGNWVLETAVAQCAAWHAQGLSLPVSVNIDAMQLLQTDFVDHLQALLRRHPSVDPGDLELEIVETSALRDMARVIATLRACRALGVRFSLDDFGTGYSSLAHLKRLPIQVLKIDQSFVRDMLEDPEDLAILQGVVGLAEAFQREVLAEGVETEAHGELLLRLGCPLGQGYAIARPMPADALPHWCDEWAPSPVWSRTRTADPIRAALLTRIVAHRAWLAHAGQPPADTSNHREGDVDAPPPFAPLIHRLVAAGELDDKAARELQMLEDAMHSQVSPQPAPGCRTTSPQDKARSADSVHRTLLAAVERIANA